MYHSKYSYHPSVFENSEEESKEEGNRAGAQNFHEMVKLVFLRGLFVFLIAVKFEVKK